MAKTEAYDSRELLLKAAKRLFAQAGYNGTSVKDIAKAAGVNISLISYHFGGKEGLYRATIEPFAQSRLQSSERFLKPAANVDEFKVRLSLFLDDLLLTHVHHPEVTTIIHRNHTLTEPKTDDIFQNSFLKSFRLLIEFITSAQSKAILDAELDPRVMAGLIFGSILHTAQADPISKKFFGLSIADETFRKTIIDHSLRSILTGFQPSSPFSKEPRP